jgi:hypothetical protein
LTLGRGGRARNPLPLELLETPLDVHAAPAELDEP